MSKVTVLKVNTSCAKCKRKVLRAVTGLHGVDKVEVDSEKSTMTVTGTVDVIVQARKAGRRASVLTIGPPPKPAAEDKKPAAEQDKKKTEEKKTTASAEKKAPRRRPRCSSTTSHTPILAFVPPQVLPGTAALLHHVM